MNKKFILICLLCTNNFISASSSEASSSSVSTRQENALVLALRNGNLPEAQKFYAQGLRIPENTLNIPDDFSHELMKSNPDLPDEERIRLSLNALPQLVNLGVSFHGISIQDERRSEEQIVCDYISKINNFLLSLPDTTINDVPTIVNDINDWPSKDVIFNNPRFRWIHRYNKALQSKNVSHMISLIWYAFENGSCTNSYLHVLNFLNLLKMDPSPKILKYFARIMPIQGVSSQICLNDDFRKNTTFLHYLIENIDKFDLTPLFAAMLTEYSGISYEHEEIFKESNTFDWIFKIEKELRNRQSINWAIVESHLSEAKYISKDYLLRKLKIHYSIK